MSAFMVTVTHIDALLTGGLAFGRPGSPLSWYYPPLDEVPGTFEPGQTWGPDYLAMARKHGRTLTEATAGHVGAVLLAENRRSVDYRYREEEVEQPYVFTPLAGIPDPIVVLSALACYRYQSCEHPGWSKSEAFEFCGALEQAAIGRLPGYDDAPWLIDDRRVFVR